MKRRMNNGNKAAMLAAFADMKKDRVSFIFDCDTVDKIKMNDIVEGKSVEYDFD